MDIDQIIICLEQKKILLTKIMDLTKQIEVRCKQKTISLESLFEQREGLMRRADKCDRLNENQINQLPPEERAYMRSLLQAKDETPPRTEEEQKVLQLAKSCSYIRQKAMVIDQSANELLKKRCDQMKEKINSTFKKTDYTTMFHQK